MKKSKLSLFMKENRELAKEGLRKCGSCNQVKKRTKEFFRLTHSKNTWGYCLTCDIERQKEYRRKNKAGIKTPLPIDLEEKACSQCGEVKKNTREFFVWDSRYKKTQAHCKACAREYGRHHNSLNYKPVGNRASEIRQEDKLLKSKGLKRCNRCQEVKQRTDDNFSFWYRKRKFDEGVDVSICGNCKDCERLRGREKYHKNKKDPKKIERQKEIHRTYRQSQKGKVQQLVNGAKKRGAKKNALPSWLSETQHNEIKKAYFKAKKLEKNTGEKYHVDHIAPLQGENVCGLHVPWNLEPITASANTSKRNQVDQKRLDTEQLAAAQYACQHWHELRTN